MEYQTRSSVIKEKNTQGELPWKKWLRAFVVPWELQVSLVFLLLPSELLVPESPEIEKEFDVIGRHAGNRLTQSNKTHL